MSNKKDLPRSVRTSSMTWNRAKKRAATDGQNMNQVINELLDGYGRGLINLPRIVKQYDAPK